MKALQRMTLNNTMRRVARSYPSAHIVQTPGGFTVFCQEIDSASRIAQEIDADVDFSVKIGTAVYVSVEQSV